MLMLINCTLLKLIRTNIIAGISWSPPLISQLFFTQAFYGHIIFHSLAVFVWIIIPVQYSEWAAPVVPVLKNDGTMRLCGDCRVTINKTAKCFIGWKVFLKAQAYLQVVLYSVFLV